jgi:hypothetical protein
MKATRRTRSVARVLWLAVSTTSTFGVAVAAEATGEATRLEVPPPKSGADGWYDARPIDDSFVVRVPSVFQAFNEDAKAESGGATRTIGIRSSVAAAFGGVTNYVASCIAQDGDERTPAQRLETVAGHWEKMGAMRYKRPIELGPSPGFEFEMADDAKAIRARVYAPSAGTCTVLVSWRPYAKPSDADLEKYLDSFKTTR